ncbi:MAG: hypothetical protein ACYDBJ_25605 [Aggregatilineales bacterium]
MIGRILIDQREHEIELDGTNTVLRRFEPPGKQPVRTAATGLYSLTTGQWNIAEIKRVIRYIEQEGLFDKPNTPASAGKGKPTP